MMSDGMRSFFIGAGVMTVISAAILLAIDRYIRGMEKKLRTT